MHNLINWYNQNRKRIWITIILIVGIFFIARRLVFMLGNRDNISNKEVLQENINKDLNSIVLSSQNSAITAEPSRKSNNFTAARTVYTKRYSTSTASALPSAPKPRTASIRSPSTAMRAPTGSCSTTAEWWCTSSWRIPGPSIRWSGFGATRRGWNLI